MNDELDLSMLDGLGADDAELVLTESNAPDPFGDALDDAFGLGPGLPWPVGLELGASTHSAVTELTDESASPAKRTPAPKREPATAPVSAKQELELFPFAAAASAPPPPHAALPQNENAPGRVNQSDAPARPSPAKARRPAPSRPLPGPAVTAMSADALLSPPADGTSSGDSASTSARGAQSPSARAKEKLAQRKLRNKESARRYREKQVARRRQLESFTRTLAEQNRELEALHARLLALTCDNRAAPRQHAHAPAAYGVPARAPVAAPLP